MTIDMKDSASCRSESIAVNRLVQALYSASESRDSYKRALRHALVAQHEAESVRTSLQERCSQLLEEKRALAAELEELRATVPA